MGNASNQDIILDFFAGSGTTAQAVMELNKQDGRNRKFICAQLPEKTEEKSEAFKAGYKTIAEISKERIRRAAKKIEAEAKREYPILSSLSSERQGKECPDLGFKVYKLKNFGSFRDFSSKDISLSKFKQANLFYGCNASGKTTLTRVFSCLNNGRFVTLELEGCELEISVNDKAINIKNFSDSHIKNKIRVFNSDFIEDNLQLKEGQAKKLSVVIGKENIDIKNDITKLEEELKALKNDKDELNVSVELSLAKLKAH
ncbi:AAA family ATPase [Candidatus Endomicrobiellum trichonymphae]|uniref:AAA family ATPase n=1 Tax=Endomicrobium trichonymphae TaxID=1408204 RepID=UPI0039B8894B